MTQGSSARERAEVKRAQGGGLSCRLTLNLTHSLPFTLLFMLSFMLSFMISCTPSQQEKNTLTNPLRLAPAGPAIEALIEGLAVRDVGRSLTTLGSYPLIDERAQPGDTLPLLSAPAPHTLTAPQTLQSLTPALLALGYQVVESERAWRAGRPLYAGISREGRPALVLRLTPPGPQLTVLMCPPPPAEVPPRQLRRLPPHVTFALDLTAPGSGATYDYLSNAQRELVLNVPKHLWSDRGLAPPPTLEQTPNTLNTLNTLKALSARWRDELDTLTSRPHLSALSLPSEALTHQTTPHLSALAQRLKRLRVTLLEPLEGSPTLALATARAEGVRVARVTHTLSAQGEALQGDLEFERSLKAVEASLVLEGSVILWVPPLPQAQWEAVARWLNELTLSKGVQLLRLSEVTL